MARKSRLQRKREKESLKQAVKYLLLIFLVLYLMIKLGLPALIRMATFLGDIRSSSEPIEQQDEVRPMAPRLQPLPEATAESLIDVAGVGEPGTTVQLHLRGISVEETVVDNEGSFEFKGVHLREGENEIYVVARDDVGNKSDDSQTWMVTLDMSLPALGLDQPKNGDRFFDKDSPITVKGTAEEEADLTVNGRFVMIKSDGSWETTINLSEGDNEIEVKAVDAAGNEIIERVVVNYTP